MFDCANVEMRELLPELAAGSLDASARARVEEHVLRCADCASELETLRLVRGAFTSAPPVDAQRIVAALPKPAAAAPGSRATPSAPVKRWMDWRIAAALTMITVGGLSVAVSQRLRTNSPVTGGDSGVAVAPIDSGVSAVATANPTNPVGGANRIDTGKGAASRGTAAGTQVAMRAQLSFNGGVSDLDDASIQALLGALDEIDKAPVAPSAEPDRSSILPVIKRDDR